MIQKGIIKETIRRFFIRHGPMMFPLALLISMLLWSQLEKRRLEKRFTTGIGVDTCAATVVGKKYFKDRYTYRLGFYANGKEVSAKMREEYFMPNLRIGWRIPLAYLEDETDEVRLLPYSQKQFTAWKNTDDVSVKTDTIVYFDPEALWSEVWIEKKYKPDQAYSLDTFYQDKQMTGIVGRDRDHRVTIERFLIFKEYHIIDSL